MQFESSQNLMNVLKLANVRFFDISYFIKRWFRPKIDEHFEITDWNSKWIRWNNAIFETYIIFRMLTMCINQKKRLRSHQDWNLFHINSEKCRNLFLVFAMRWIKFISHIFDPNSFYKEFFNHISSQSDWIENNIVSTNIGGYIRKITTSTIFVPHILLH